MASADRIERERMQKRARILDVARALFVERGVEAVTLREIAQRIEYSTTAIYMQFADKAALVEAMLAEDFAAFAQGFEAVASVEDPVVRLVALFDAYSDFAVRMPHHYQLLFLTPAVAEKKPRSGEPTGIDGYRVLRATVEECIRAKRFRAEVSDVDATAHVIWATVHGLVSLDLVMGRHPQFGWPAREVRARAHLDMLMHGLLRDPAEIKRVLARKPARPRKR